MPERWPQVCRVKMTFELLTISFVSTATNSMKCLVDWVTLNLHVCFKQTPSLLSVIPRWILMKQRTSESLWPQISLNRALRGFQKPCAARNFENMTLVARRRKNFRGPRFWRCFFVAELPPKRRCLNTQEFTRFLITGVVSVSRHARWRVL